MNVGVGGWIVECGYSLRIFHTIIINIIIKTPKPKKKPRVLEKINVSSSLHFDIPMAIKIAGIFITKVRKKYNPFIKVSKPNSAPISWRMAARLSLPMICVISNILAKWVF